MLNRDALWATLEQWSSIAFLVAGGSFLLLAVAFGFEAATSIVVDVSPAVIFLFLLVVFVGLLGLYPGLAEQDSPLALGGLGLLGATAALLISTLVAWGLPFGVTLGKSTLMASIVTVAVGSVLTVTTFGVASFRTDAHARSVGVCLLVMGTGVSLMIIAMLLYGDPTPAWVSFTVNGLVAMSLTASGYALRPEDVRADNAESTDDVATSRESWMT